MISQEFQCFFDSLNIGLSKKISYKRSTKGAKKGQKKVSLDALRPYKILKEVPILRMGRGLINALFYKRNNSS